MEGGLPQITAKQPLNQHPNALHYTCLKNVTDPHDRKNKAYICTIICAYTTAAIRSVELHQDYGNAACGLYCA